MKKSVLMAALSVWTGAAWAARVDVYAQSFRAGGWKLDVQFMDQMGSPYLLAHGLGSPVPDATAEVALPERGEWRVWVRTREWVKGAGAFNVLVDGVPLKRTFGVGNPAWGWTDGGTVATSNRRVRVTLRDLDGFDARCAGVVFTRGADEKAPEGAINVTDREPASTHAFDFVVVGGGVPGCCAAVAAARAGLKVALVQDRPVLGGNASGEIRVWCAGEVRYPLVAEMRSNFMNMLYENTFSDADRLAKLQREPNLSVFLSHRAFGVDMKNAKTIGAVKALDLENNRVVAFAAPLFCDCTGDGWVGFWAGADWRYGREASGEYGETFAPKTADKTTLGASIMWESYVSTYDSPFSAPWAEPYACGQNRVNGDWNWEYGLDRDMFQDGEVIRDRLLLAIYGAFSNAKKDPVHRHRRLVTCPFLLGKRESRRLMGDWVYSEKDITEHKLFEDAVATGSWSIDLHYTITNTVPFLTRCQQPMHGRYWIPYRSIYSRNVGNLFMAGRCFSCTHVGLGGPRVINTLSQLGCAAGEAAAMCRETGLTPRGLFEKDKIRELQRRLGGDFPGNPDPATRDWAYVDDEDASTVFKGPWSKHMLHNGGQQGDWTHSTELPAKGGEAAVATYKLPVKTAGRYKLMGRVPHLFNESTAPFAALTIVSGGKTSELVWDQYTQSGWWSEIGTFELAPGATLTIDGAKSRGKYLYADGFAIVPVK